FNKILVIADEGVSIQQYEELAKYVFKNLNPATDIYFSQGPMDVLDHSCSKLGFGGKMCIDGTVKFEEERDETYGSEFTTDFNEQALTAKFPEIKAVNSSLLKKEISVLIISVEKKKRGHVKELHQQICALSEVEGVKLILYVEHTVDANDLPVALWRFCNNLDPKRDHILATRQAQNLKLKTQNIFACMGFDGTIKTKELDNFQRDWPNIIVSDEATIRSVDAKWERLGLGEFIPSPSLKFKDQMYGEEAVAKG
ncbi:MAG: menaquinone biosynthesis decarboxylase, partial [Flavisolibacter sp.]